jgi:hypothetical protein
MSKPTKPANWRSPMRIPPPSSVLQSRGLRKRLLDRPHTESADEALERAMTKDWGGTIVEERPYWTGPHWIFICKEAA